MRIIISLFLILMTFSISIKNSYSASEYSTDRIIVKHRSSVHGRSTTSKNISLQENFRHTGISVYNLNNGKTVEEALTEARKDPAVLYAEPDYIIQVESKPDDKYYSELWGIEKSSVPAAWEYTKGSKNVIVAVIDTGVDYNNFDLRSNMYINKGEIPENGIDDDKNGYIDDIYGYNFVSNNGDPWDDHGHGTHCAGTIGAIGNNGVGVIGVSPDVSIMALKFLNASGSGYTSKAIKCIEYAAANGATILSNSWGGVEYSTALRDAIAAANSKGVTFVAAAGNYSTNTDNKPFYPACYNVANVISVGASDQSDNPAYFSNFGEKTVDIFAPGVDILSTVPGDFLKYYSGTSMAAPHVSGTLALYASFNNTIPPSVLRSKLITSADRISKLNTYCVSSGRLNTGRMIITDNPSLNVDAVTATVRGGDGDSFAESGETLSLYVEIINTGDVLRDVSAKLISYNSSVKVLSAEAGYPDTLPGGKALNTTPFRIYIANQGDIYQPSALILQIKAKFGETKDRVEVPLYIGNQCTLLFIDDDGGSRTDKYITDSLSTLGINFASWDVEKRGVPPLTAINPVSVIWNTGNMQGQVLSPDEITEIRNYLTSGGAFCITGDEWADELASDSVMHTLFKASVISTDAAPVNQIGLSLLAGFSFSLPDIAVYRDRLSPLPGADLLSADSTDTSCGSITMAHTSDISGPAVSSSFDISAMAEPAKSALIEKLISIITRPEIISVTPYNSSVSAAWRTYNSVRSVELMLTGETGEATSSAYTGNSALLTSLTNGKKYRIKVRAIYTGGMKSAWSREISVYPGGDGISPLPEVTGITSSNGNAGILFAWNSSADTRVKSYNVEVYNKSGRIAFLNTTENSILLGREYLNDNDSGRVLIYALDANSNAGAPSETSWEYADVYPPDDVIDITITKTDLNAIKVSWGKSNAHDLKRYIIDITTTGAGSPGATDSGQTNTIIFRDVPDGAVSAITIKCEDTSGNISQGSTVLWGTDGKGKGNEALWGCSCDDNQSEDYEEAGFLSSAVSHLLNLILICMGGIITTFKRIIIRRRERI